MTSGKCNIKIQNNDNHKMSFSVESYSNMCVLETSRLYYLGYRIEFENNSSYKSILDYMSGNNGVIIFVVSGDGNVSVKYTGSILNIISNYVSIITLLAFLSINCLKSDNIILKKH